METGKHEGVLRDYQAAAVRMFALSAVKCHPTLVHLNNFIYAHREKKWDLSIIISGFFPNLNFVSFRVYMDHRWHAL